MGCFQSQNVTDSLRRPSIITSINIKAFSENEDSNQLLGVQLAYFEQFIEENGGRTKFNYLTAKQVSSQLIEPKCKKWACQLAKICERKFHRDLLDIPPGLFVMLGDASVWIQLTP